MFQEEKRKLGGSNTHSARIFLLLIISFLYIFKFISQCVMAGTMVASGPEGLGAGHKIRPGPRQ